MQRCANSRCPRRFTPRTSWQKYCSNACKERCRNRVKRRINQRAAYNRRPERQRRNAVAGKARKKALIRALKEQPCADCGGRFPYYVMDFDHVRGEKYDDVGAMLRRGYALETILDEIAKCDLVCANCHRVRTFERRGLE